MQLRPQLTEPQHPSIQAMLDLANCHREPIHIPARIQPHGVLLAVDKSLRIVQASANTELLLNESADRVLGTSISDVLGDDAASTLVQLAEHPPTANLPTYLPAVELAGSGAVCDLVAHVSGESLVIELMPIAGESGPPAHAQYQVVRNALARVSGAAALEDLYQAAVEEVQRITGFDRVMVYRFDPNWNGEVVAEVKIGRAHV